LLLHKKEGLALENTLRLAEELGMLDGRAEQIIDSTPMLGAAATQDTVRLVRHGVKKLIDAVKGADEEAGGRLDEGLEFDYRQPREKPDCRWREKAERERMLTRVAQDAERALAAVEGAEALMDDEHVKAAHQLLRELIGQDFDIGQDGVPRLHRGTRSDRIISTVDTEMRHGRKSSQTRFDGYKLSASATNSSEPLVTAVHVSPAGETDGPQAKHLVDSQPPARRPELILGDTAYGNGPVRAELAERNVQVLAPVPEGKVLEGRFGKHDFEIDLEAATVSCPAGSHSRASPPHTPKDRATPRTARPPLRCPQKPLHRQRQGPIASRVGRSAGQPQPNRTPTRTPEHLTPTSEIHRASSTTEGNPIAPPAPSRHSTRNPLLQGSSR
jgi:hypothetical protein